MGRAGDNRVRLLVWAGEIAYVSWFQVRSNKNLLVLSGLGKCRPLAKVCEIILRLSHIPYCKMKDFEDIGHLLTKN